MARAIPLGRTRRSRLVLSPEQRSTHMQLVGASGRGKSKLLEAMVREDILSRHGLCLIDPHGTLYDDIMRWCASNRLDRRRRIHLINPADPGWTIGFNPLRRAGAAEPSVRVDAMVEACAAVWGGEDSSRTPLLKKCLRAVFYALLERDLTLLEAIELTSASDPGHVRAYLTSALSDSVFEHVWRDFNGLSRREFTEQFSSTNNRLIEFLASPVVRRMIGQQEPVIDFRRAMDEGDVVLVNLAPKGTISPANARLIGTLITNDLFVSALTREERTARRHPFYLYIDECYQFLTEDIERMLDQTRKFGLHVILAHQRLGQLRARSESIYNAVMTGAQTKVVFGGLEDDDAEIMAKHIFRAEFDLEKPKRSLDKPVVVDHIPVWLTSESESESETTGTGETTAIGVSVSGAETQQYDSSGAAVGGVAVSSGGGTSEVSGTSSFSSHSYSRSFGQHEALKPVIEWRPTQVHTLEELVHLAVVKLRELPKRAAIVKSPNRTSVRMRTLFLEEGYASARTRASFEQTAFERSAYAVPVSAAEAAIETRRGALRKDALAWQSGGTDDDPDDYYG